MKSFLLLSLFWFSVISVAFSQDTIITKTGTKIQAVVLEVNDSLVEFKMYDDPLGVLYLIPINDVDYILFKYNSNNNNQPKFYRQSIGLGTGLDYGGFLGLNITFFPFSRLSLFGAVGKIPLDISANVGTCIYFPLENVTALQLGVKLMYGYNTYTYVKNAGGNIATEYNNKYLGFTAGLTINILITKMKRNAIAFDFNYPFLSNEYISTLDKMKKDPRLKNVKDPKPVAFSIGYRYFF